MWNRFPVLILIVIFVNLKLTQYIIYFSHAAAFKYFGNYTVLVVSYILEAPTYRERWSFDNEIHVCNYFLFLWNYSTQLLYFTLKMFYPFTKNSHKMILNRTDTDRLKHNKLIYFIGCLRAILAVFLASWYTEQRRITK